MTHIRYKVDKQPLHKREVAGVGAFVSAGAVAKFPSFADCLLTGNQIIERLYALLLQVRIEMHI